MLNVLLVGKQPIFRQGLATVLESTPDLRVVKEVNDVATALSYEEISPDIILLDVDDFDGLTFEVEAASLLQQKHPGTKIIILANSAREDIFVRALKAGVKGYLLKTSSVEKLTDSIRFVASGDTAIFAGEGSTTFHRLLDSTQRDRNSTTMLSPREREILCHIAKGETTKEVAGACCISQTTVKAHIAKILQKLNVKNRSEAVATAVEQQLLNHCPSGKN